MGNPWLGVPLSDYEGHMRSAAVGQLNALSELFAEALAKCRPRSVGVLGIAGGNGLEHIDVKVTRRIVGVDVNPSYLAAAERRYKGLPGLELHCADLAEEALELEPVELVHAALIFEHTGLRRGLENALSLAARGGWLSVVLQLPGESDETVGASPFPSIQKLRSPFVLVNREELQATLEQRGFRRTHQTHRALPGGKGFWMGLFQRLGS